MYKIVRALLIIISCFIFFNVPASAGNKPTYQVEIMLDAEFIRVRADGNYIYAVKCDEKKTGDYSGIYAIYDNEMNMLSPFINELVDWVDYANEIKFSEGLLKIKRNDKYGYLNTDCIITIESIYEDALNFINGVAPVKKGRKWGVIDSSGETVIDFLFSYISDFTDGKAVAQKNGVMGVLDICGDFLELPYKYLSNIKNGYIFAGIDDVMGHSWGDDFLLWYNTPEETIKDNFGFIDVEGNIICPFTLGARRVLESWHDTECYFKASYFNDDGYAIVIRGNKYGMMDTKGKLLNGFTIDFIADGIESKEYFTQDGLSFALMGGKYGIINSKGELLQEFIYDWMPADLSFSNLISCDKDGKYYYIDKDVMEVITEKTIKNTERFGDCYVMEKYDVLYRSVYNVNSYLVDPDGEVILQSANMRILGYNGVNVLVYFPKRDEYELFNVKTGSSVCKGQIAPISAELLCFYRDGAFYLMDWDGTILKETGWRFNYYMYSKFNDEEYNEYTIVQIEGENIANQRKQFNKSPFEFYYDYENSSIYGLIDKHGDFIIDLKYMFLWEHNLNNDDNVFTVFEAHNYTTVMDNDIYRYVYTLPEDERRHDFFDTEGNLVFYCAKGNTYSSDNIRIYDKEIDLVEYKSIGSDIYIILDADDGNHNEGIIRIRKNAETINETGK